jgi:hypothetical protein
MTKAEGEFEGIVAKCSMACSATKASSSKAFQTQKRLRKANRNNMLRASRAAFVGTTQRCKSRQRVGHPQPPAHSGPYTLYGAQLKLSLRAGVGVLWD